MRTVTLLREGWQFSSCSWDGTYQTLPTGQDWVDVTLPHVWNGDDPKQEGPRLYRCTLALADAARPAFVDFGAVAGICHAWLNGCYLGCHKGGYARFRFALTGARAGSNELLVLADNTHRDYIPLGGDFNNYGGIYRPVHLIQTGATHFDLLYYGTSGLTVEPGPDGKIQVSARIAGPTEGVQIQYEVLDQGEACACVTRPASAPQACLQVSQPHSWNGRKDPYLYTCRARLLRDGVCLDEASLSFGFRSIELSPEQGFFLNGQHLKLRGAAKHQDWEGCRCAVSEAQQRQDIQLFCGMGANAVRLSHYQHPDLTYDLCDQAGLVVWAEIPLLALPDGNEAVFENAKQQLTELILQLKHHPSICFWGVENEISMAGESLEMYRKIGQLHQLAKELDPTRFTTLANINAVKLNSQLNHLTDAVGYNIYFGWYYGEATDYGPFFDRFHKKNPDMPLCLSEYGADSLITLHRDDPRPGDCSEEFQCRWHETAYPQIEARDFVWGSFVWNMFDFGSANRAMATSKGRNCKGLVTYDRSVCKDAYYFYKACWSEEPFVYLTGRRFARRCGETTTVKVYSNAPSVTLTVNGQVFASQEGNRVFVFDQVPLAEGDNRIAASAGSLTDAITLTRVAQPEQSYIYDDPNPGFNVKNWFTLQESKEDLFPADHYSIMDEMGDLMKSPEAWALLEQEVPRITSDPLTRILTYVTLLRKINTKSSQYSEDFVKELNRKLNAIPKPQELISRDED